ncbi:riboflavin synthase [Candidatus Woesearchaeota archaeon]|nr:riboflavin synthase [Candidatus Woesearchaeota archaeon]
MRDSRECRIRVKQRSYGGISIRKIGIADTMFARADMFSFAEKVIKDSELSVKIERYTVPGVKDLPVACKKLVEEHGCEICMALGMPGPEDIDKTCTHEASQGIIQCQLLTNRHIIEVFVHADEAEDDKKLLRIVKDRTTKHAHNAVALLKGKTELSGSAGQGKRQGHADAGPLDDNR